MSLTPEDLVHNHILRTITEDEQDRLLPQLKRIELPLAETVYATEQPIEYIYFPIGSMVSVIGSTADGQSTEIGVIGREGIVGIDLLLGARSAQNGHTVQIADGSLRMPAEAVMDEFRRGGAFQSSILSFVRKFLSQVSQTAVCNRLHPLEQRLARWLLMCADRSPTPESLMLTQEFLSIMAGATRTSVTLAAIALRSAGFINYSRGKITILDREGLEDFSCECYSVVKESYEKA